MNIRRPRHLVILTALTVFTCSVHAAPVRSIVSATDLVMQERPSRADATVPDDSLTRGPDSLRASVDSLRASADSLALRDSSLTAASDSLVTRDSLAVADSLAQDAVSAQPAAIPAATPEQKRLDEERERYREEYETEQKTGLAVPKPARTQTEPPPVVIEESIDRATPERQVPAEQAHENVAVPTDVRRARQQAEQQRVDEETRRIREEEAKERDRELRERPKRE
jgi:hypothetical protein